MCPKYVEVQNFVPLSLTWGQLRDKNMSPDSPSDLPSGATHTKYANTHKVLCLKENEMKFHNYHSVTYFHG